MEYKFDDIVIHARTGLNPRDNFKLGNGDKKYITIKNIRNQKLILDDNTDTIDDNALKLIHKRSQIKKGDVLFASIGRIGDCYIIEEEPKDWDINESVFAFTLKTDIIQQKYFCYYLQLDSVKEYLTKNSSGSTFKSIKMNQLKKMIFDIPSLEEQNNIVYNLDKIDTLIYLHNQQLSDLDLLVKSQFIEMFGDPEINNLGWESSTFGNISKVRQGLQIPIAKRLREYIEGCYEYITVAYLNGSKEREYILNPKDTVVCTKDDILMTRTGNTGMVITDVNGVFHNNFFLIDFNRNKFNKVFLVHYLNTSYIQADLLRRAGTSTIPDLNHGEFYKISIYIPPIDLQNKFVAFVQQVDKSKFTVQQSLNELELLKKKLMQDYFG